MMTAGTGRGGTGMMTSTTMITTTSHSRSRSRGEEAPRGSGKAGARAAEERPPRQVHPPSRIIFVILRQSCLTEGLRKVWLEPLCAVAGTDGSRASTSSFSSPLFSLKVSSPPPFRPPSGCSSEAAPTSSTRSQSPSILGKSQSISV